MLRKIRYWLGGRHPLQASPADAVQAPTRGAAAAEPGVPGEASEPGRVWRAFLALMLGVDEWAPVAAHEAERDIIRQLDALASPWQPDTRLLPRLPQVLPELLRVLRDPESSLEQVASVVAREPSLVAAVTRTANSVHFRTARPLKRLRDAILLIGHDGLRRLLPTVAMQPIFHAGGGRYSTLAGPHVWAHAQRCALAGMSLGGGHGDAHAFEHYLAGLAQGAALVVAVRALDAWPADAPPPRSMRFGEALQRAAGELALHVARGWGLPDGSVAALGRAQEFGDVGIVQGTMAQAGYLAMVRALAHNGLFGEDLASLEPRLPGLGRARLQRCYSELLRFDESDLPE